MKRIPATVMAALALFTCSTLQAQISIGGYHVYYGHLHNHSNVSDGKKSPDYAYNYAKTVGKLDFFSLADHSNSISQTEWKATRAAADKYNEPGVFTAFWGFEWTNAKEGHVAVINSADYISTSPPTQNFPGLCDWLKAHECIAFLNHPGHTDETGLEFRHFASLPCEKVIGIELWNNTQRFERFYYGDGYYSGDGKLGWYDEALSRGWHLGAAGSEDNHAGTWGRLVESKMAVLATGNSRTEIMDALKARRFYSTYDLNLALSFKIGGNEMGSTVNGGYHNLEIRASDGDGEVFTRIELLRNGFVADSWTPDSTNPVIKTRLHCVDREYYYVRVLQEDGSEAISSPIWISDGPPNLPPSLSPFGQTNFKSQTLVSDFSGGYDGWTGDFADYPVGDSLSMDLQFRRTHLPAPLDTGKYALLLSGNNHSDDLFMFIRKKITGLTPNKIYKLQVDLELASDAPTHAIGIGGAPGESVYLKAGAALVEPRKVESGGFYIMNIDKANQALPGADMDTLGHIGVSDTTTTFSIIHRTNAGHLFSISTDESGSVWVCIGTDSGFEGTTTLYYSKITLSFDNLTGIDDSVQVSPPLLFPNPVSDVLYVRSTTGEIRSIELFNLNGQSVMIAVNTDRISLKNLRPGLYSVRITYNDNTFQYRKIVVQ